MLVLAAETSKQLSQPEMWVLLGLGAAAMIYLGVIRPMMRKKDPLEKAPAFASLAQQRATERQMQNLLVEFSDMAREVSGRLDTRAAKLEALIREADAKLAELRALTGQQPAALTENPEPLGLAQQTQRLQAESEPPDPRHADVYALADQGRDPYEIASALGRPRGEVELILALRKKDET